MSNILCIFKNKIPFCILVIQIYSLLVSMKNVEKFKCVQNLISADCQVSLHVKGMVGTGSVSSWLHHACFPSSYGCCLPAVRRLRHVGASHQALHHLTLYPPWDSEAFVLAWQMSWGSLSLHRKPVQSLTGEKSPFQEGCWGNSEEAEETALGLLQADEAAQQCTCSKYVLLFISVSFMSSLCLTCQGLVFLFLHRS